MDIARLGLRMNLLLPGSQLRRRLPFLALALATALGAILRAYHLGFKPLRFDEALFYWIGQGDLQAIIRDNALFTSEPPLFAILTALVSRISSSEVALRLIPFTAGIAAIPAIYFFARRYLSEGGALAASVMVAFAPNQVQFSQQLREYSLSSLFTILLLLSYVSFLDKKTWRSVSSLAVATAIGMFIHYSLALVLLGVDLVFLASVIRTKAPRKQLLFRWLAAQLVGGLAALVVYWLALRHQLEPVLAAGYLQGGLWEGSSIQSAGEFAYGGIRDLMSSAYPGYAFTLMFYTGSAVLIMVHRRKPFPYLIAAPIAVVVIASLLRLYPLGGGPQDLFLTPLVILVAATGVDYLFTVDSRRLTVAVFLSLIVWRAIPSLLAYYPTDGVSSVGRIIDRLATMSAPGDPVYLCRGDRPELRYYVRVRYPMPLNPIVEGIIGPGPRDYIDQVDIMLKQYGRAWMVVFPPCGDLTPLLDHVARDWKVDLIEERYPDTQLYYVH